MFSRMLINAAHSEECRVAIIEDKNLVELEIESNSGQNLKGTIFKARISRIEPSLQAAFVDIGTRRNAFLQINDIHPSYFKSGNYRDKVSVGRVRIQDVLEAGQEIVVQVVKEERDQKGATVTTFLSLPGRYLVLMPGTERGGVSRKIFDDKQRQRLKALTQELEIPKGIGIIVRTAGLDRSLGELSRDLSIQLKLWEHIVSKAQDAKCPEALYQESDLATSVIRDYFTPNIREVIVDEKETYERVKDFIDRVMPRYRSRLKLHDGPQPLFSAYEIEEAVSQTLKREVKLKSGGSIVIDSMEALVAIDVNSGKATSGGNIEETAYRTNLEAAEEIAKQLRLRDLGGLIVVDFIDMWDRRHRGEVERRMRTAISNDKARTEVGKLSRFGLLEMSRQRLRAPLNTQIHSVCSHCLGIGKVKNAELVALEALRKIQSAVITGHLSIIKARLSPGPALFLLNSKRADLSLLESKYNVRIYVLADGRLRQDDYELELESQGQATQTVKEETRATVSPQETKTAALERRYSARRHLKGLLKGSKAKMHSKLVAHHRTRKAFQLKANEASGGTTVAPTVVAETTTVSEAKTPKIKNS